MATSVTNVQITVGRTLTATETAQATLWIEDARAIISLGRDGRSIVDLDGLDQTTLDMVVREAVASRVKRPDDASQVSVQVDDAQVSRRYESGTGQIEITDRWWDMLFPTTSRGAFTISAVPRHVHHHHGYPHAW